MVKIICSAIHIQDTQKHKHQPKNIASGFVVCGLRHHNCIYTYSLMQETQYEPLEGFLTSDNHFVTRKEAYIIAKHANQIITQNTNETLFSEDLW